MMVSVDDHPDRIDRVLSTQREPVEPVEPDQLLLVAISPHRCCRNCSLRREFKALLRSVE